jgi:hypothetical protein
MRGSDQPMGLGCSVQEDEMKRIKYTFPEGCGSVEGRTVEAVRTCSKHFVITPAIGLLRIYYEYHITHFETGMIACSGNSIRKLRKIAGALSGLPIAWGKLGQIEKFPRHYKPWVKNYIRELREVLK